MGGSPGNSGAGTAGLLAIDAPATLPGMQNAQLILVLKIGVIVAWLVGASGFLFPSDTTFGQLGRLLLALLTVVHAVECTLFYSTLRRTGRPLGFELIQTLFFGAIHFTEAKALAESREER